MLTVKIIRDSGQEVAFEVAQYVFYQAERRISVQYENNRVEDFTLEAYDDVYVMNSNGATIAMY